MRQTAAGNSVCGNGYKKKTFSSSEKMDGKGNYGLQDDRRG
jgi:hypothetical protein